MSCPHLLNIGGESVALGGRDLGISHKIETNKSLAGDPAARGGDATRMFFLITAAVDQHVQKKQGRLNTIHMNKHKHQHRTQTYRV